METFSKVSGIFLLVISIVCAFAFTGSVFISSYQAQPAEVAADQYYYLPAAQMTLSVTATVQYEKMLSDNNIKNARRIQQVLAPVDNRTDISALIAVQYTGNWFCKDDVHIVIASSLLEEITISIEEWGKAIVANMAKAPANIAVLRADHAR